MGKSAAANWAARWTRGMAKAQEFEDPTSRYQNPRYSGKGVPDRANHPKRQVINKSSNQAKDK